MRQNKLHDNLIFLIISTTTWQLAVYPYTTGTQKAAEISDKNSSLYWVHSIRTKSMSTSHLFTNSCHHISTNCKTPPYPHKTNNTYNSYIRSDKGLTLETPAFQIFHGGNSTFINSFDKTKFVPLALWLPRFSYQKDKMRDEWKRLLRLRGWWFICRWITQTTSNGCSFLCTSYAATC